MFDGTNTVNGTVNTTDITFSAIPSTTAATDVGFIADANGAASSKTYTLKIWVRNDLNNALAATVDGLNLAFRVDAANPVNLTYNDVSNSNQKSSRLVSTQPTLESGAEQITVVASQLVYNTPGTSPTNTNPQSQIGVTTPFSANVAGQDPEVYALDANNNLDLGYSNSANITNPLQNYGQSVASMSFVSGKLALNPFYFTTGSTSVVNTKIVVTGTGPPAVIAATSTDVAPIISNLTTISAGAGTEPGTISSLTTALTGASAPQLNAVANFDFTVTDDFGANGSTFVDNDGLPTQFDQIVISQGTGHDPVLIDWSLAIAGAELSLTSRNGVPTSQPVTTPINVSIGGTSITFNSIAFGVGNPGRVNDGEFNVYTLKISLQNPVDFSIQDLIDNTDFVFSVSEASFNPTAANTTSTIATSSVESGNNNNTVTVVTTQLDFVIQPPATSNYDVTLAPVPQVKARDANQNLDLNYSSNATLSPVFVPAAPPNNVPHIYPLSTTAFTFSVGVVNLSSVDVGGTLGTGINNDQIQLRLDDTPDVGSVASGSSSTIILTYSNTSYIVRDGSFSQPTNIVSINNREKSSLTVGNSIALDRFLMSDGGPGVTNDNDGSKTKLQSIMLNVSNYQNLSMIGLFDEGGNKLQEIDSLAIATGAGTYTFSSFITPFEATDNDHATKLITVRASFRAYVTDNQQINVSVLSATAGGVSSQLIPISIAGDALAANENKIEVVATKIDFTTVPPIASNNVSFIVVTQATDLFENLDADYNGAVSFTGTPPASGNTSNYDVLNLPTGNFAGGILNYPVDNIGTPLVDEGFLFTSGTSLTQLTIDGGAANTTGESVDAGAITGISPPPGIDVKTSFDSWLYFDPGFAYTTRIPFVSMQESTLTNSSNSVELARLVLSDGGAPGSIVSPSNPSPGVKNLPIGQHSDIDGAFTIMEGFTISLTNFADIRKIGLFDAVGNPIGSDQNGAATVTFSGLSSVLALKAADNDVARFYIRASFNPTIGADLDQITIQITDVVWGSGSQFPLTDGISTEGGVDGAGAGGDSSDPAQNYIDVVATSLDFFTQASAIAGINEPIDGSPGTSPGGSTAVIHSRDIFDNLDTEFNFPISISAPSISLPPGVSVPALPANPLTFVNGVLKLDGSLNATTGMRYTSVGNGTLEVIANGINSSVGTPPGSLVDVIHVTATENNNGVVSSPNIKGGTTNVVLFGVTFNAQHYTTTEPNLTEFSFVFDLPYATSSSTIFENFKVFESTNGTFAGSLNVEAIPGTIVTEHRSDSLALTVPTPPLTTHDAVTVTFPLGNYRNLHDPSNPLTYYLVADVDPTANIGTPPITPQLSDAGYGYVSNSSILITKGSSRAKVEGKQYSFASTRPPTLVDSYPKNGQLNVDPAQSTITLIFDVGVWSLDGEAKLYDRQNNKLIATLSALNGVYSGPGSPVAGSAATGSPPLAFSIPAGVVLKPDSVYFVTIAKGTFDTQSDTGTGISDDGFNLFGGISYSGTLYFKIASTNPPVMKSTEPLKYYISQTGGAINASFDQYGKAYFMVVNPGDPVPTNAQIKTGIGYPGTDVTRGTIDIKQVYPNTQFGTFTANLTPGNTYDVWMYAENDALPLPFPTTAPYGPAASLFAVGTGTPGNPTFKINVPLSSPLLYLNQPTFQICANSETILADPIMIAEGTVDQFVVGTQDFNILLPTGFEFVNLNTLPTVTLTGSDFDLSQLSRSFINSTILNVSFVMLDDINLDNIVISNLQVKANSTDITGAIIRFGGTALTALVPDGTAFANIVSSAVTPLTFNNSYAINNDFSAAPIFITKVVTSIPDNFVDPKLDPSTVRLLPIIPLGDFGPSFFGGSGVTNDILNLTGVALNSAFDIAMTHTDMNGCISTNSEQYTVYDHDNAIPILGTKSCIVNSNFPGIAPSILSMDTVIQTALAGYKLISLTTSIPTKAAAFNPLNPAVNTLNSQIIFGPEWQKLVVKIPVALKDSVSNSAGTTTQDNWFRSYKWDYTYLLNARSLSANKLTDPYEFFKEITPQGRDYYKGGSIGLVEFTGKYQSNADNSVQVPIRQEVEIFVPAIPVVEVSGQSANIGATPIFCEQSTTDILISGYPAASAGASKGFYILRDSALNTVIYDAVANIKPAGFVDNSNGTANLTPSLLFNTHKTIKVDYTYQDDNSPCSSTGTLYIRITPNPVADFTTSTLCEDIDVTFTDASSVAATAGVFIDGWTWDFADPESPVNSSKFQSPTHIYVASGLYANVNLNVITNVGCQSVVAKTADLQIGGTPDVDFDFLGVSVTDMIDFKNKSTVTSNDSFNQLDWTFGDGGTQIVTSGFVSANHQYLLPNFYDVKLKVTSTIGCVDSLTQRIIVLSQATPTPTTSYLEDFETNNGMWQPSSLPTSSYATNPASWVIGTPATTVITISDPATFGSGVAKTSLTGTHNPLERSAWYSPSFDLSQLVRPMVSFNSFTQMAISDGVVLQYSIDNKNVADPSKKWEVLGKPDEGIDWLTDQGITAKPGNQPDKDYGWSNFTKDKWMESKHAISDDANKDPLVGASRVVFRFALASLKGTAAEIEYEGFAIDNFRIGERTRTILLENFTTTNGNNNATIKSENEFVSGFEASGLGTTVVKINYHIGFTGSDPFNVDNPADPSARALYYNVKEVPWAFLDGARTDAAKADPKFSTWGQNAYNSATLQLGQADIVVPTPTVNADGSIKFDVQVTALYNLPDTTVLHVAIIEQSVIASSMAQVKQDQILTGEGTLDYVLKEMLPNASGTKFGTALAKDQTRTFAGFEFYPDNTKLYENQDDLAIVIFLQHEGKKNVYQTELITGILDPPPVTGLENAVLLEHMKVFPNPADNQINIQLPGLARQSMELQLVDQVGKVVTKDLILEGTSHKTISSQDLAAGIYILQIGSGKSGVVRKKILVVHQD